MTTKYQSSQEQGQEEGRSSSLEMRDIRIEGFSDDVWHPIIKGVDLKLHRGEVMGLIGESGAGKSTLGKAAMGYAQPGCRITDGTIEFDGMDLRAMNDAELRKLHGSRIAYVAQSAAASFNPAHRLIDQCVEATVDHGLRPADEAKAVMRVNCLRPCNCRTPTISATAIRTRYRVVSCSGR